MPPCQKKPYPNRWTAEHVLDLLRREKPSGPDEKVLSGTYFCADCRAFHLTSKGPSVPAPWEKRLE